MCECSGSSIMGRDDGVGALGGRGEACKAGREASDARMRAGKRTRGGKRTNPAADQPRPHESCSPGLLVADIEFLVCAHALC